MPWDEHVIAYANSSSHSRLPQNFQDGLKTSSGDRCEREIITVQLWCFVIEEPSGMEGKEAQQQEAQNPSTVRVEVTSGDHLLQPLC